RAAASGHRAGRRLSPRFLLLTFLIVALLPARAAAQQPPGSAVPGPVPGPVGPGSPDFAVPGGWFYTQAGGGGGRGYAGTDAGVRRRRHAVRTGRGRAPGGARGQPGDPGGLLERGRGPGPGQRAAGLGRGRLRGRAGAALSAGRAAAVEAGRALGAGRAGHL